MFFRKKKIEEDISKSEIIIENLEYIININKNAKFDNQLQRLLDEIKFSYPSNDTRVEAVDSEILRLVEDLKIHISLSRRDDRIQSVVESINELIAKRNSIIK